MVWKNSIRKNAEEEISIELFSVTSGPIREYNHTVTNAITIGDKPNRYHQIFTRHRVHPANNLFTPTFPSVIPTTTAAEKLGVQEARAINKPMTIVETDAILTTAPMKRIAARKNR
jgi:hypothetical protein